MNEHISVVLTAHKSKDLIINYIKNIYQKFHIVVIDNSNDVELEKEIKTNFPNVTFKFMPNKGYGAAINFGSKFVKTKYFLVSNPDVKGVSDDNIIEFYNAAIKLNNQFSMMGPIDLDHKPKKRKDGYDKNDLIETNKISGICMFFNKKNFDAIAGFDENIFLYFEDNDICKRLSKINKNYQLNTIKVNHKAGTSVILKNENDKNNQDNLRTWHFIWSKFYYYKKHYTYPIALIFFIPTILRIIFRICFYKIVKNNKKINKYKTRWSGLIDSIMGKESHKRV
tara:strand:- start:1627 stop:2472 length:846 start_codon:yes stop_codon:yes gene_type:complete